MLAIYCDVMQRLLFHLDFCSCRDEEAKATLVALNAVRNCCDPHSSAGESQSDPPAG